MKTIVITAWIFFALFLAGLASQLGRLHGDAARTLMEGASAELGPTISFLARVGLAHLLAGAAVGCLALGLARWLWPEGKRSGPAIFAVVILAFVFGRDAVMRPVLYEPVCQAAGAGPRAGLRLLTRHLSPTALDVAWAILFATVLFTGAVRRRRQDTRSTPDEKRTDETRARPGWRLCAINPRAINLSAMILGGLALGWAGHRIVGTAVEPEVGLGPTAAASVAAPASPVNAGSTVTGSRGMGPTSPEPGRQPLNLVLLGTDSLRADRLQALGATRRVLPNIDALAAEGVVFRQAYVPLARTLPSIVSLLTGCDPHTHGIRHMFPPRHRRTVRTPTLPALLAPHGYRSAVVSDYAGEMFNLVDLGFDTVDAPPAFRLASVIQREVVRYAPAFLPFFNHPLGHVCFPILRFLPANADPDWLEARISSQIHALDAGRPFFLMGFFSTTHTPYAAPYPGYRRFADPGYRGPNQYAYFVRSLEQMDDLEKKLPTVEVEQIRALYDGACFQVDAAIGRLVRDIRRRGLWDRTLIVIFSDHGEHLYEPGNTSDHGKWFRGDEANRIPLVLAGGPVAAITGGTGARVVDGVVRSIDLLPTLLAALGLETPATVEGVDLGPRIRGEPAAPLAACMETGIWLNAASTFRDQPDALLYPSIDRLLTLEEDGILVLRDRYHDEVEEAKHRCLRTDRWKLVYTPTRTGVRYALYDVHTDPGNERDLAAARPEVTEALAGRLRSWMRRDPGKTFDTNGHLVPGYTYGE